MMCRLPVYEALVGFFFFTAMNSHQEKCRISVLLRLPSHSWSDKPLWCLMLSLYVPCYVYEISSHVIVCVISCSLFSSRLTEWVNYSEKLEMGQWKHFRWNSRNGLNGDRKVIYSWYLMCSIYHLALTGNRKISALWIYEIPLERYETAFRHICFISPLRDAKSASWIGCGVWQVL